METSGNIDDLIKRVLEKARNEAAGIIDLAQRAAERETHQARLAADKRLAEIKAAAEDEIETRRRSAIAEIRISERKAIMDLQESAVKAVFDAALDKLRNMPHGHERRSILINIVKDAIKTLGAPLAIVRLNRIDKTDSEKNGFPDFIDGVKIIIDKETIDCAGGAIVFEESMRVSVDNTFEARLDRRRSSLRDIAAKRLGFRRNEQ